MANDSERQLMIEARLRVRLSKEHITAVINVSSGLISNVNKERLHKSYEYLYKVEREFSKLLNFTQKEDDE